MRVVAPGAIEVMKPSSMLAALSAGGAFAVHQYRTSPDAPTNPATPATREGHEQRQKPGEDSDGAVTPQRDDHLATHRLAEPRRAGWVGGRGAQGGRHFALGDLDQRGNAHTQKCAHQADHRREQQGTR